MPEFASWLNLRTLYFEGESTCSRSENEFEAPPLQPEPTRFKCWIGGMELKRFRIEYHHRVLPVHGSHHFSKRRMTETFDGETVSMEMVHVGDGDQGHGPVHHRTTRRPGHLGSLHETGLFCLPPFLGFARFQPFAEMHQGRALQEGFSAGARLRAYRTDDRSTMTAFHVVWDLEWNNFISVRTIRRGLQDELLKKVREQSKLTPEEILRLRTERVVVATEGYRYGDFEEAPRAGIHFPRSMAFIGHQGISRTERSFSIARWDVNLEMPDTLFKL